MNWLQAIKYGIEAARPSVAAAPRRRLMPQVGSRARVSWDLAQGAVSGLVSGAWNASLGAHRVWHDLNLDSQALQKLSPHQILELLADISPEVSNALWQFLRFCNPGFKAIALRPSGATTAPQSHQRALDGIVQTISDRHGAIDLVLNRLFLGGFLRGSFVSELVFDEDMRQTLDLAIPDPASIAFRSHTDPLLGVIWEPGQWQNGHWVSLDLPTFSYVPIDPLPGRPEGRSPASPAILPAIFLLAMFHDLRRVVQQQGYPRIDLEIVAEQLLASMPSELEGDPDGFRIWAQQAVDQVVAEYGKLEPDDAYVHLDSIKVNRPVGTLDSSSLGAVAGLIASLERMLVRALKTMPLLQGITDGVSEANANRQWEMHAASIKALQHLVEQQLERLLGLALQAQGIPAIVQFRFAELRASEQYRDALTESLHIENTIKKYNAGWISQDQASMSITGQPADAPGPRATAVVSQITDVPIKEDSSGRVRSSI